MESCIREKFEEFALLVAMLHEDDEVGFAIVFDILKAVRNLAADDAASARLVEGIDALFSAAEDKSAKIYPLVIAFAEAAEKYVRDPSSARFPNEAPLPQHSVDPELTEAFDADLVSDFIQEHSMKMDDFESVLISSVQRDSNDARDLNGFCKSYLHNIKGDAGTVGLGGIQKTAHFLEDLLCSRSAPELIDVFLQFKEWVLACLKAYMDNEVPQESSSAFISRINAMLAAPSADECKKNAGDPSSDAAAVETSHDMSPAPAAVDDTYQLSGDLEIFGEFIAEAEDHFQAVEGILLEKDGHFDAESINSIFRAVHSIKGASAYFNLIEVTKTSHVLETLLDRARKGIIVLDAELKALVLAYIDLQRKQLTVAREAMASQKPLHTSPEIVHFLVALEAFAQRTGSHDGSSSARPVAASEESGDASSSRTDSDESKAEQSRVTGGDRGSLDVKTFVKIDLSRLDSLIEHIGEMVISSSMLISSTRKFLGSNQPVMTNAEQLEQLCHEIQEIGMSMRLVPIKGLLQKMSRLVWDTSRKIKKDINFSTEGEDTELDRTVIDRLADPLMHMIRNSLDHGIEMPSDREKAGKPRTGQIKVEAFHRGGNIHIKISDDGKGLNPDTILRKAVEKGLVTEGQKLSQDEIFHLIFAPGFSTAEKVTDISGRGVGMDVVRRNIESMRGRVTIESEPGKGSIFTIQLPLTLAIVEGIETCLGSEHFIIPTHSIVEFVKPKPSHLSTANGVETFQFRERFIPVFHISRLYGAQAESERAIDGILAVVESDSDLVAIVVDSVVGNYSSVIKPLGSAFEHVKGLAGGAIMSDGTIGLILDIPTLVQYARSMKIETIAGERRVSGKKQVVARADSPEIPASQVV